MDSGSDSHKCKVCGQEVGLSFVSANSVVTSVKHEVISKSQIAALLAVLAFLLVCFDHTNPNTS